MARFTFETKLENRRNYTAAYVFIEYPKWVTLADGTPILVNNAEEEKAAIGTKDDLEPVQQPPTPDNSWGTPRNAKKGN